MTGASSALDDVVEPSRGGPRVARDDRVEALQVPQPVVRVREPLALGQRAEPFEHGRRLLGIPGAGPQERERREAGRGRLGGQPRGVEGRGQPGPRALVAADDDPVVAQRRHRGDHGLRIRGLARAGEPVDRAADVLLVGVQTLEPGALSGGEPLHARRRRDVVIVLRVGEGEPVDELAVRGGESESAQRDRHRQAHRPRARCAWRGAAQQDRAVDELGHAVLDRVDLRPGAPDDVDERLEVESALEDRRGRPQQALARPRAVEGRADPRLQGSLGGLPEMARRRQHAVVVLEPSPDPLGGQRAHPLGGELDRQGQPVGRRADADDRLPLGLVQDVSRVEGPDPVDEEGDGVLADQRAHRDAGVRRRDGESLDRDEQLAVDAESVLPDDEDPQVAAGVEQLVEGPCDGGDGVLDVVDDEQRLPQPLLGPRLARRDAGGHQRQLGEQLRRRRVVTVEVVDPGEAAPPALGRRERDAGLADADRPGEGHQAVVGDGGAHGGELRRSADERGALRRERSPLGRAPGARGAGGRGCRLRRRSSCFHVARCDPHSARRRRGRGPAARRPPLAAPAPSPSPGARP